MGYFRVAVCSRAEVHHAGLNRGLAVALLYSSVGFVSLHRSCVSILKSRVVCVSLGFAPLFRICVFKLGLHLGLAYASLKCCVFTFALPLVFHIVVNMEMLAANIGHHHQHVST